jgi:hypothetical protein
MKRLKTNVFYVTSAWNKNYNFSFCNLVIKLVQFCIHLCLDEHQLQTCCCVVILLLSHQKRKIQHNNFAIDSKETKKIQNKHRKSNPVNKSISFQRHPTFWREFVNEKECELWKKSLKVPSWIIWFISIFLWFYDWWLIDWLLNSWFFWFVWHTLNCCVLEMRKGRQISCYNLCLLSIIWFFIDLEQWQDEEHDLTSNHPQNLSLKFQKHHGS